MNRRTLFVIALSVAAVAAGALPACVGDEPAPVTPVYLYADGGNDKPDGDGPKDGDVPDAGWSPAQLQGLELWLDARDSNTLQRGTGAGNDNRVTQWNDKSRRANHFKAPALDKAPYINASGINDRPSIEFHRDEKLYLAGKGLALQAAQVFLVVQAKVTPDKSNAHWRFGDVDANICYFPNSINNTGTIFEGFGSNTRFYFTPPNAPATLNLPHVYSVVATYNEWFATLDGKLLYRKPDNDPQYANYKVKFDAVRSIVGASAGTTQPPIGEDYFDGLIGELIIVDRKLEEADLAAVKSYLTTHWEITQE